MPKEFRLIEVYDNKGVNYGLFETMESAHEHIKKVYTDAGFKSYYWRFNYMEDGDTVWIDYGSHTHFFYTRTYDPNRKEKL